MPNIHDNRKFTKQIGQKPYYLLNLILFLIQIQNFTSVVQNSCYEVTDYKNDDCFNDKIEFHDKFRAGHFVTLKDGTLIIEYSSDGVNYERFFYGLKKNGRYYFPNESPFKHFHVTNPINENHGRYESENKIVFLSNDTNKEKEYNRIFEEDQVVFEPKEEDAFNEENLENEYFNGDISNLDRLKKENKKLEKDIWNMLEQDQEKKFNISKAIESISDILPENKKLLDDDYKRIKDLNELLKTINSSAENIAEEMKKTKGSFRITDGAYKGDNLSFKYYENNWGGRSRAKIQTYSFVQIGKKINNFTIKLSKVTDQIDKINDFTELVIAFGEDGYKYGDKSIVKTCEILGENYAEDLGVWAGVKMGAKLGYKLGSFVPVNPIVTKLVGVFFGGLIGGIIGSFYGSHGGKKVGEIIVDLKNGKKEDEKEEEEKD